MKDARTKVLSMLKLGMADRGYRLRAASDQFWRTEDAFTWQWQTRFMTGHLSVEVEPSIGIRSEVVERIFHQTSTFPAKSHAGTSTIGASLANLEGVDLRTYTFQVANDEHVSPVADALLALFDEKAVQYFARYGNLPAIDHLLNDRPTEHTPHCRYGLPREARGLIVAKLVGRPNYSELEAYYRSRIAKLNSGFYVTQFESLVSSIASLGVANEDSHDSP